MKTVEKKEIITIGAVGLIIGIIAVVLVKFGNPGNMGFCIACFIRDTVGGLGLQKAEPVMYIRPEIIGLVLGAFIMSLARHEFKPRGGSAPLTRFVLGFFVMIGCLMFLGCPLRMILRLAGGDLNALIGLLGFIAGIAVGVLFLKKGFSLKRSYAQPVFEGVAFPAVQVGLLILLVAAPAFILFSTSGPGSKHAPLLLALAAGLVAGILAQRTRLCLAGGIRDVMLFRDFKLITGFVAILVGALVMNLCFGYFTLGFEGQAVAHNDFLWNFLGMLLVGYGCVLLGGCPLRQLILAGEGSSDSAITVLGLAVGAAFCHNFGLASSADGPTFRGKIAVLIGLAVVTVIAVLGTLRKEAK